MAFDGVTYAPPPHAQYTGSITAAHPPAQKLGIGLYNLMPNKRTTGNDITAVFTELDPNISITHIAADGVMHKSNDPEKAKKGDIYEQAVGAISWKSAKSSADLDAIIVTGGDLGAFDLSQVDNRSELIDVFDETANRNIPKLMLCWAAHAHLEHEFRIEKEIQTRKSIGVYEHDILHPNHWSVRSLEENTLKGPLARCAEIHASDIDRTSGVFNIATRSEKWAGIIGYEDAPHDLGVLTHFEYGSDGNFAREHRRDVHRHYRDQKKYPTLPLPLRGVDVANERMGWGAERKAVLGGWLKQARALKATKQILRADPAAGTGKHMALAY